MLPETAPPRLSPLGVLVVEDEAELALELACALRRAGFAVRLAPDAPAAARLLATAPDIGVLVADIGLPGEDRRHLVARLLADAPPEHAMEAVLMSGAAGPADVAAARRPGAPALLQKPFPRAQLVTAVAAAAARARARRRAAQRATDGAGARPMA